jgi:hypothetical protein
VPPTQEEIDIKGEISLLIGRCPDVGFLLSGRVVRTNAETDFKIKCSDLKNGREVKVKGVVRNDGVVLATRIQKD